MIPVTSYSQNNTPDWKRSLREAVRNVDELCALLKLDPDLVSPENRQFPLLVPRGFLHRIKPGDPLDPLLLQVLPQASENNDPPGFTWNPVGDITAEATPGLLHKYYGRVLLITTGACAIHCRYCFRKHFPYADSQLTEQHWAGIAKYLSTHLEIDEVILSGGDPLILDNSKLARLIAQLENIPHLQRLRIHTRLPIVLPERIDGGLVEILSQTRLQALCVIHANHANELDIPVERALNILHTAGIHLLNQSVLLRAVNDSLLALENLSRRLIACQVIPYYLHLLDPVSGSAHFKVDQNEAKKLIATLRIRLPGYLVPKLVTERAGELSKIPL